MYCGNTELSLKLQLPPRPQKSVSATDTHDSHQIKRKQIYFKGVSTGRYFVISCNKNQLKRDWCCLDLLSGDSTPAVHNIYGAATIYKI